MRDLELLINCEASFSQNIWHASKQSTYSKNIFTAIIRYEKSCNCEKFGNMTVFFIIGRIKLKIKTKYKQLRWDSGAKFGIR